MKLEKLRILKEPSEATLRSVLSLLLTLLSEDLEVPPGQLGHLKDIHLRSE